MAISFDPVLWTALGTWVLVIGTLIAMWWQARQQQRLASANAVMELRDRFDSPAMRVARAELAEFLLAPTPGEGPPNFELPRFFELMGFLTHRKVLDPEMIWNGFGGWVSGYWNRLRRPVDFIGVARSDFQDPLIFAEFEWLEKRMVEIDRRRLGSAFSNLLESDEEAKRLLSREATLRKDGGHASGRPLA